MHIIHHFSSGSYFRYLCSPFAESDMFSDISAAKTVCVSSEGLGVGRLIRVNFKQFLLSFSWKRCWFWRSEIAY